MTGLWQFSRFRIVLVTGPQRSGTQIGALAIAHDAGMGVVWERAFSVHNKDVWRQILKHSRYVAIQCPSMCRYVHEKGIGDQDDIAVVLMRRPLEDILMSERRIDWTGEAQELARYPNGQSPVAQVKYEYWDQVQRKFVAHPFEIEYEGLSWHPLWVPKEERGGWGKRQTSAT